MYWRLATAKVAAGENLCTQKRLCTTVSAPPENQTLMRTVENPMLMRTLGKSNVGTSSHDLGQIRALEAPVNQTLMLTQNLLRSTAGESTE